MPDHWQETTLGEALSECRNGLQYKNDPSAGGLPISRIQTISGGRINLEKVGFAGLSDVDASRYLLEAGDILFSHINSVEHVGNSVLVEDHHLPLIHGMNLLRLRSSAICLSAFLFLSIADPRFRSEVRGRSKKAVNQVSINQTALRELPITLPPLEEQRRIVDLVGSIDTYIDSLETQIETTRTARSALLSELLSNPGDDWQETSLEECCDILDRLRQPISSAERAKRPGTVPYFGAAGQAGWIDEAIFDEPLVLLGEDAVDFASPTARKAYCIEGPSWVNNHAHVLRPGTDFVNSLMLELLLNGVDYTNYAVFGTRSKLTQAAMKSIRLFIPPLDEQRRIVDLVGSFDEQVSSLESQVELVRALRSGVLSELLSGERLLDESYDVAVGL